MFCLAVRDCARQIQLQTYSQPISIPAACISIAFSRTAQDNINYGLDVSIDEAVRLYKPYAGNEDWCSTLTGEVFIMHLLLQSVVLLTKIKVHPF